MQDCHNSYPTMDVWGFTSVYSVLPYLLRTRTSRPCACNSVLRMHVLQPSRE